MSTKLQQPAVSIKAAANPQARQGAAWRRLIAHLLAPPAGDVSPTCRPQGAGLTDSSPPLSSAGNSTRPPTTMPGSKEGL